jgi:hypothetical protein
MFCASFHGDTDAEMRAKAEAQALAYFGEGTELSIGNNYTIMPAAEDHEKMYYATIEVYRLIAHHTTR